MRVFITACTEPSECFDVFYCYILQNKSITFSLSHTKTVEKEKKNNVLLTEKVQCLKPEKINKMMFFLDTLGKGEEKRFKGKKNENIHSRCRQVGDTEDIINCLCCCLWSFIGVIALLFCIPFL